MDAERGEMHDSPKDGYIDGDCSSLYVQVHENHYGNRDGCVGSAWGQDGHNYCNGYYHGRGDGNSNGVRDRDRNKHSGDRVRSMRDK